MINSVLEEFGLMENEISVTPVHQGLINSTWKIAVNDNAYILQKINNEVFKNPADIAYNIATIARYLKKENPNYNFIAPLSTATGLQLINKGENGYYRIFPFVKESHTLAVAENPVQAYEAAKQFGKFTAVLNDFESSRLKITIPHFHNLPLRYQEFLSATENGNLKRVQECAVVINQLKAWLYIVDTYKKILQNPDFKIRVTHHDTKISNVLFDNKDEGICVIDLDTVMPGYFISDVGDMMRTYLSPVSEEETDFSKIYVRPDMYEAIVRGYSEEMSAILTETETKHFFYAGIFMTYMQAVRFLTDFINNDVYYREKYPGQNLNRAKNQVVLLQHLLNDKPGLTKGAF